MKNGHLRRLERIWIRDPIVFITSCTAERKTILHIPAIARILIDELRTAEGKHGWYTGAYVIMPDHIHFLCRASDPAKGLSEFMQHWKEWTSKRIQREMKVQGPIWQPEFFDRILRSNESYMQKRDYIWNNPVRAKLVRSAEEWEWVGELNVF